MRRLSLLMRFGLISAVCIAALGYALFSTSRDSVEQRALEQAVRSAQFMADVTVLPLLEPQDFFLSLGPEGIAELDAAVEAAVKRGSVTKVKVFGPDGQIVYSDDHDLIGGYYQSAGVDYAMDGELAAQVKDHGKVLEAYVPVRFEEEHRVAGVFEIYVPYGQTARAIAADVRRQTLVLAGGLLLLYVVLFRTVAAASRRLRSQSEENERLALHDPLTGLPNRALFAERVERAVASARRSGKGMAVLLVDLDRFKEVNDTLGHHMGDMLLDQVGRRLGTELREIDTVARLGGDEFAVLLAEVAGPEAACEVGQRLLTALEAAFEVDGVSLEVGASVGVACFPDHATDEVSLLQHADVAMYEAKEQHAGVVVYATEMDDYTPARLAMFGELRRGIENGELTLHYQPQVDLASGRVRVVEALVRWNHPTHGLLPPSEFIDLAEQTVLIKPLTAQVLDMALAQCRSWRDDGLEVAVAVNLSVRSLVDAELPDHVARALRRHGLPSSALVMEITESTVMADPGRALAVLGRLQALGVATAIDDYGTGYSSLAYLRRLPIDCLKIDRSFVLDMDQVEGNAVIVRSTIELARNLGLSIVAEGVETADALQALSELGCDAAQGYHLARPGPPETINEVVAMLEGRSTAALTSQR